MNTRSLLKKLLPLLLVFCMLLSSCVSAPHEEHTTTGEVQEPSTDDDLIDAGPCKHTETKVINQKKETCGANGYTGDSVCTACGEMITKGEDIPATLQHVWDEGTVTQMPTCLAEGVKTLTCTVCAGSKEEPVAKVAHKDVYHDALDGTHNLTCGTCTAVNENAAHTPVDANGTYHEATCQNAGYTEYECKLCHGTYRVTDENAPQKAHSYGEWFTVDATCSDTGRQFHSCNTCGHEEVIELPVNPLAHDYSLNLDLCIPSTCETAGENVYTCRHCDAQKAEDLPLAAHNYRDDSSEAASTGWTHKICNECDFRLSTFDASDMVQAKVNTADIPSDKSFEVALQEATIEFPKEVVDQMKNAGADVDIKAGVLEDTRKNDLSASLNDDQKNRLNDVPVYDFSAGTSGENFDAKVKVTLPYVLKAGEDPAGIKIWYLNDSDPANVVIESLDAVYDAATETVTFEVEHFSFYAIAYEETQEMKCRRGEHNYETVEVITATCYNYGYTKVECKGCHKTVLQDHKEKLAHNYGSIVEPTVTCGEGGYRTKVCQNANCGHTVQLDYVRATGHKLDRVASCTESSSCTICKQVITPALGHAWSEWSVILEPTDVNPGLRRRHCPVCGKKEEVRLAPTGNIEQIDFNSYQEMMEALMQEVIGAGDGTVSFTVKVETMLVEFNITVDEDNGSYVMLVDGKATPLQAAPAQSNGTTALDSANGSTVAKPQTFRLLYRNGVVIVTEIDSENINVTDIESLMTIAFGMMKYEDFEQMLETSFDFANSYVEEGFAQASAMLSELISAYGEKLNAVLAAAGSEYTAEDLKTVLDAMETVYAYMALKLGYNTNLTMVEGIVIPTKNDVLTVLDAFCTLTVDEATGNKTYTYDVKTSFTESVEALFVWLDECMEMSLGEFIFDVYGASITEKLPEVTSWEVLKNYIKAQYPATLTAGNLVDRIITSLEESNICTAEELYALVNEAMIASGAPADFDIETVLNENANVTLDEICQEMMGCTVDEFYANVFGYLDETLVGELPLSSGSDQAPEEERPGVDYDGDGIIDTKEASSGEAVAPEAPAEDTTTVADAVENIKQMWAMFSIKKSDFKLIADKNGNLLYVSVDANIEMAVDQNADGSFKYAPLVEFAFEIDHTKSVTVEVPSNLQNVSGQKVTYTYDANGNLIVSGLNPNVEYDVSIDGNGQDIKLDALLKLDTAMTAEKGYNVYVLDKQYWHESQGVGELLLAPDGKYYEYGYIYMPDKYIATEQIALGDIVADYTVLLPDATDVPFAKYNEMDVYNSALGYLYQEAGTWYVMDTDNSYYDEHYHYETDTYDRVFYNVVSAPLAGAAASIEISNLSINSSYRYEDFEDEAGNTFVPYTLRVYMNGFADAERTIELDARIDENDNIILCEIFRQYGNERLLRMEEAPAPDHDEMWDYEVDETVYDENGDPLFGTFKIAHFSAKVPTYYVSYNGTYYRGLNLFNKIEDIASKSEEEVTLPDGRILYLVGAENTNLHYDGGVITEIKYGYLKAGDGVYIAAACLFNGNSLYSVRYYNGRYNSDIIEGGSYDSKLHESFDCLVDLTQIQKQADGTYMIPAAMLKTLREQLDREGESFGFVFSSTADKVSEYYLVGAEIVVPDPEASLGSSNPDYYFDIDMEKWFTELPKDGYAITVNDDGSITVIFEDGQTLTVAATYYDELDLPVDSMVPNAELSNKYGLPIYTLTRYDTQYHRVIFKDGKYYEFSENSDRIVTDYTEVTLDTVLTDTYLLESISLFIDDAELIENNIYRGYIIAILDNNYNYEMSMNVYVKVVNGQLMVLTGVTEVTDSIVKYEGTATLSEYMNSLTVELVERGEYEEEYSYLSLTDDTPVYSIRARVLEGEVERTSFYIHYFYKQDDTVQYIVVNDDTYKTTVKLGNETTKPDFYSENTYEMEAVNGTFTVISGSILKTENEPYVLIAGKYYDYIRDIDDDYYHPYDTFENAATTSPYVVASEEVPVWYYLTDDGTMVFVTIESYDENGCPVYRELSTEEIDPNWLFDPDKYPQYVGMAADGREIFEITAYVMNKLSETIDDKTVFLYEEGMDGGYIAYTNAFDEVLYIPAVRALNENGEYEYTLINVDNSYSPVEIEQNKLLEKYITVDKSAFTVSADLFAWLGHEKLDRLNISIETIDANGGHNKFHVSGWDLKNALEDDRHEDLYPGEDFYPEVDYAKPVA